MQLLNICENGVQDVQIGQGKFIALVKYISFSILTEQDNGYDIPEGIVFSFPVTVEGGKISVVQDIAMPDQLSKDMLKRTIEELVQERESVSPLLRA